MSTELQQLMEEIADDAAAMDLGAYCSMVTRDGHSWFDTTSPRSWTSDRDLVHSRVRYLELRGKLIRHPAYRDLVRMGAA